MFILITSMTLNGISIFQNSYHSGEPADVAGVGAEPAKRSGDAA